MKQIIYADNAATTKLDIEAFEAMKIYLLDDYSNPSQPYSFSRNSKRAIKEARKIIADCINAEPDEIYFTSGGSESDNWAIKGIVSIGAKGEVLTSEIEHHAVLNACQSLAGKGITISYVKPTKEGVITKSVLKDAVSDNTKLVSIMFVNNEVGTIQPIKELCDEAHKSGALFHTDAVQAVGHLKIDVKELGIDLLSASAHKFNGPKGIGFLYIKKGLPIASFIDGGAQENGYRAGTENVASIIGMAVALKNNCANIEKNASYIKELEQLVLTNIGETPYFRNGGDNILSGIMSLSFPNMEGEALLHRLDLMGIMVSTGAACDSVKTQISHVLSALGVKEDLAKGTIRISLGKNNTKEEACQIGLALRKIIG